MNTEVHNVTKTIEQDKDVLTDSQLGYVLGMFLKCWLIPASTFLLKKEVECGSGSYDYPGFEPRLHGRGLVQSKSAIKRVFDGALVYGGSILALVCEESSTELHLNIA